MATVQDFPLMLRVEDVVQILGVSRTYAYALIRRRTFPVVRLGKAIRIPRDRFFTWLDTTEAIDGVLAVTAEAE